MTTRVNIPNVGTVRFPDSMSKAEIQSAVQRLVQTQPQKASVGQAVSRSALSSFLDNFMKLPNVPLTMAANAPIPRLLLNAAGKDVPSIGQNILGLDSNDAFAATQLVGETAAAVNTGDFNQFTPLSEAQKQQRATSQKITTERPVATLTGGLLGDAATLVTGRAPIASAISKLPARVPRLRLDPGGRRAVQNVLESDTVRKLARGAGRSLETGLEGAILSVLNDADPIETGTYAAAGQLGGSALLSLGKGLTSGGLLKAGGKIGMTAFAVGSLIQLAKSGLPGGSNFILPSIEAGYDKVLFNVLLGGLAGVAGAGRLRGRTISEDLPQFADAITSLPRGAILSALSDYQSEDQKGINNIERVTRQLSIDPSYFSESELQKLEQAYSSEKISLSDTIKGMIDKSPEFRQKFDRIDLKATATPRKQIRELVSSDNRGTRPISSTKAAESIARHIPKDSSLRRSFESNGPKSFTRDFFQNGETVSNVLPRLGKNQRLAALEVNLNQIITGSIKATNNQRVIDAERLQSTWQALPDASRNAYPKATRETIELFIDEALASPEPIPILPPLLARSLMMDGQLSKRLRGIK